MMRSVVILCFAFSLAIAAPSRSEFRALMEERVSSSLLLHKRSPFPTKDELLAMPQGQLVDLLVSITGTSTHLEQSETPQHVSADDFDYGWPPVWPHPKGFTNGTARLLVTSHDVEIHCDNTTPELTEAFKRFIARAFSNDDVEPSGPATRVVEIFVVNPNAELQLETDESYNLTIPLDGPITLTAETQVGVLHGLETLSQLIFFDFDDQAYFIPGAPWDIKDAPRFKHREVLIDTSRHFLPVSIIYQIIDSLTYAKLNVIHWHIVDEPSFPVDIPSYPRLSKYGSFSPQERYSSADVKRVVDYARQRGVRVMVEIDMPGHAGSWCAGHPEICPSTDCTQPLNPATNQTFELIAGLLNDLTGGKRGSGVFFENLFHLGGDEVNTQCWAKSPSIQKWMTDNNLTVDTAYYYFVGRAQAIAKSQGRDPVGWEEIWKYFGTKLDKQTIIHQWLPGSTVAKDCIAQGYRVLWSTDGVWYLDGLSVTWQTMYSQEPCSDIDDASCAKYLLGGGGEMWGETADPGDVLATIWPRAGAIAERLWSPRDITNITEATPRMMAFRCLIARRGVAAAPPTNKVARSAPSGPGSCYKQ